MLFFTQLDSKKDSGCELPEVSDAKERLISSLVKIDPPIPGLIHGGEGMTSRFDKSWKGGENHVCPNHGHPNQTGPD